MHITAPLLLAALLLSSLAGAQESPHPAAGPRLELRSYDPTLDPNAAPPTRRAAAVHRVSERQLAAQKRLVNMGWALQGISFGLVLPYYIELAADRWHIGNDVLFAISYAGTPGLIVGTMLSNIVGRVHMKNAPRSWQPRPGRIAAEVSLGLGFTSFGLAVALLPITVMDGSNASQIAIYTGMGLLGLSLTLSNIDNTELLLQMKDDRESASTCRKPQLAVAPTVLPRGGGLGLALLW